MRNMAYITAHMLGIMQYSGECWSRIQVGRGATGTDHHPNAPQGMSFCRVCKRTVCRGMGKWWE